MKAKLDVEMLRCAKKVAGTADATEAVNKALRAYVLADTAKQWEKVGGNYPELQARYTKSRRVQR